jgi:hypothetical protein
MAIRWAIVGLAALGLSSCSSFRRAGLGMATPLFQEASFEMMTEANFDQFRDGIAGNVKFLEGLLYTRPNDKTLLVGGTKAHAGMGFGVYETLALEDKYKGQENSTNKARALYHYSRATEYGRRFLAEEGVEWDKLTASVQSEKGVVGYLDNELGSSELEIEGVFFTAQSWGGMINLQRDKMILVAQLPVVKGMFDWACAKKPDLNFGACGIFNGTYEAGRPKMLGGNPEKGREFFEKTIAEFPNNWLVREAFLENYAIPQGEEDIFDEQEKIFSKFEELHKNDLIRAPHETRDPVFAQPLMRLYQTIAVKRFQIMKKYKKDIF